MLCEGCMKILHRNKDLLWNTHFDLEFPHHKSTTALRQSIGKGCTICTGIAQLFDLTINLADDRPLPQLKTRLAQHREETGHDIWCYLDINLHETQRCRFVLAETKSKRSWRHIHSSNTSSDEVLAVAQKWIEKCRCADAWKEPGKKWYPRRLLDLEELRNANEHNDRARIRLVESSQFLEETAMLGSTRVCKQPNHRYVTLSHCWGKPREGYHPLKLTDLTMARFTNEGIQLGELPNTFKHALLFASKLDHVRFVWIDSLCIRQPLEGPTYEKGKQLEDWMEQSRFMDKVYRKAYLNISATASTDGHGGLFRDRTPREFQESVIEMYRPDGQRESIANGPTKCTITDVSAWTKLVDRAPINKRGWVVQERLLAPRVLHFCHNQVAWECGEFDDAEMFRDAMTSPKGDLRGVEPHGRIKDLSLSAGMRLRDIRLAGKPDPDLGMQDLYVFELWKRVVEGYSQTDLSYPSDVLVALAGIARYFHIHLFSASTNCHYLAGMWSRNLESQLLWHANDSFEIEGFHNPAKRFPERAPSFSWAAIETPYGITYGEVTDYGLALERNMTCASDDNDMDLRRDVRDWIGFTSVNTAKLTADTLEYLESVPRLPKSDPYPQLFLTALAHSITLSDAKNPFGMIDEGTLLVQPRYLHRIELVRLPKRRRIPYCWYLKPRSVLEKRSRWEFTNNYLDAPESDTEIFQQDAELFVMPVAYGKRTDHEEDRYLHCLLLKSEKLVLFPKTHSSTIVEYRGAYRAFKRVGLSKIGPYRAENILKALEGKDSSEAVCLI